MNLILNYPVCTWKWALANDFNAILSTTRPSTWKTSPISTLMKSELLSFNGGHSYLLGRSLKNKMVGGMTIFLTDILTTNIYLWSFLTHLKRIFTLQLFFFANTI